MTLNEVDLQVLMLDAIEDARERDRRAKNPDVSITFEEPSP